MGLTPEERKFWGGLIHKAKADQQLPGELRDPVSVDLTGEAALDFATQIKNCKNCLAERVDGFSCGGRGFCPAWGSRRAFQKADRIGREVWPQAGACSHFWAAIPPPAVHIGKCALEF